MKILVVESKVGITEFYPKEKIITSTFYGRANIEVGIAHLNKTFDFYKKNQVLAAIVDISKTYGSFAKALDFFEDAIPIVVKSGLKCLVYVISDDIIIKNLIDRLLVIVNKQGLQTNVFKDRKEAEAWVKHVL